MSQHCILEAVLSEYAGNHERHLSYWMLGVLDDGMIDSGKTLSNRPHADAMLWARDEDEGEGSLQMVAHEEYGYVWEVLGGSAGSVRWQLDAAPNQEQWNALIRALDGLETASRAGNIDTVRVQSVSLSRVETLTSELKSEAL
jgi:hypothetical protein